MISARSWSISTPFDGGGGAELYPCGREARHIAVRAQLHDTKVGDAPGSSVTDPHDTAPVAPTEEGERLLKTLGPALNDIAAELSSLSKLRKKPAGTIRINPILMGR